MSEQIFLVSTDNERFPISSKIIHLSGLIDRIIQDFNPSEDIPLQSINSQTLRHILEYSSHHDFSPPVAPKKPLISSRLQDNISNEWDVNFINSIPESELLELINASNYLDMKSLLDLCLARLACEFKDKTIPDLQKEYGIHEEFTPETEEKLKIEYSWALEVENE